MATQPPNDGSYVTGDVQPWQQYDQSADPNQNPNDPTSPAYQPPGTVPPGGIDWGKLLGPALTTGATLAGAAIQSGANSNATAASLQGTREALQFQREQAAAKKAVYDQAMAQYQAHWQGWQNLRMAALKSYGFDVGSVPPGTASAAPAGSLAATGASPGVTTTAPATPAAGNPYAGLIATTDPAAGAAATAVPLATTPAANAAPVAWNDWNKYGLR